MEQKRPRGRPKGSGIDDGRYLDEVADFLLKNPELKKTPAIARVVVAQKFPEYQHKATVRRLLRKWNETGDERMKAACERRAEARRPVIINRDIRQIGGAFAGLNNVGSVFAGQFHCVDSVVTAQQRIAKQLKDMHISPALRTIQEQLSLIDPPAFRRIREASETIQRAFKGV